MSQSLRPSLGRYMGAPGDLHFDRIQGGIMKQLITLYIIVLIVFGCEPVTQAQKQKIAQQSRIEKYQNGTFDVLV